MKATGIVRRIDDLGRVVIPKEIRRTLRIKEGDPLEIYTDRDGEVIFKKYSPIGEMQGFASTKTKFSVRENRVEMVKSGEFSTRICFTQGAKERVELQTAMGAIPVTVLTTRLAVKAGQDAVFLRLSYTLSDGVEDQIFNVTLRARKNV